MPDAKKHLLKLMTLFVISFIGIGLSGCADSFLPKVKPSTVTILKTAIETEFSQLTSEFDRLDQKGDLGLCAPLLFGVARYAVYQAVEEKRTATMAQLTRFIMRARSAIKRAEEKMQKKQCVDTDGDGLTDLIEYRKYKTKPDNADTDGDKVSDSLEVRRYRTNPLKADTDGDLLDDGDEISHGLNALLADSDGDGFIDGIEFFHGSNARDACSQPLDAQNLDRLRECGPKQVHAKPAQVRTPKERTPAPAQETKEIVRKKRRLKVENPKTRSSPKPTAEWTRNDEQANFEKEIPKPALKRNGSNPVQTNQAIRTRQVSVTTPLAKKPQNESIYTYSNHLPTKPQDANQYILKKADPLEKQARTTPEESPVLTPATASPLEESEKTVIPITPPLILKNPKPAKKKSFSAASENFPAAIFLRLW